MEGIVEEYSKIGGEVGTVDIKIKGDRLQATGVRRFLHRRNAGDGQQATGVRDFSRSR
ncbi:MAG: hypothetical protein WCS03_00040 [Bacteroidota bacterium]